MSTENDDLKDYRLYIQGLKDKTLLRACQSIDACVNYTGDNERLGKVIQGIAAVYRAEREGNGEHSEEEVLDNVKFAIQKLKDTLEGK